MEDEWKLGISFSPWNYYFRTFFTSCCLRMVCSERVLLISLGQWQCPQKQITGWSVYVVVATLVSSLLDLILIWGQNVGLIWGQTYVRTYGPSTRYVVLFRVVFNELVFILVTYLCVYDLCVAQSSRVHFFSGKFSTPSHHFCQQKLSIHVKNLLCVSCTSPGVGLCCCLSFYASVGWDGYEYHSWASHRSQ